MSGSSMVGPPFPWRFMQIRRSWLRLSGGHPSLTCRESTQYACFDLTGLIHEVSYIWSLSVGAPMKLSALIISIVPVVFALAGAYVGLWLVLGSVNKWTMFCMLIAAAVAIGLKLDRTAPTTDSQSKQHGLEH